MDPSRWRLGKPLQLTAQVIPIALAHFKLPGFFQERQKVVKAADRCVILAIDPGYLLAGRTEQESFFQQGERDLLAKPPASQTVIGGRERSGLRDQPQEQSFDFLHKRLLWIGGTFSL